MSNTYAPKTPALTGRGRIANKSREHDANLRRVRTFGYGVTSGPLGTWVAFTPRERRVAGGGGRDTWAA